MRQKPLVVYYSNDNLFWIKGLFNNVTGIYVNAATYVRITVTDRNGDQVAGQSWPLSLNYVSASNGNWNVQLINDLRLRVGDDYTALVEVETPEGHTARFRVAFQVRERRV